VITLLAEPEDTAARAVHASLGRRLGRDRVVRVGAHDLARARWSHRVSRTGTATSRVVLPGGRLIQPDAVLHRLVGMSTTSPAATPKDRQYIASELDALVASWLLGLGPRVLGPTSPYAGALGPSVGAALARAEKCGLPVARRAHLTRAGLIGAPRSGERHVPRMAWPGAAGAPVPVEVVPTLPVRTRLLVVADRVHGPLSERFGGSARLLTTALHTNLLQLSFAEGPALVDVTTLPRLDTPDQVRVVTDALLAIARSGAPP
jgi:hypothetical protein